MTACPMGGPCICGDRGTEICAAEARKRLALEPRVERTIMEAHLRGGDQSTGENPGRYVDRSEIIAEAYPGASNDIAALIEFEGGLVCEQHPWLPFEHARAGDPRGCAGPGMTWKDAVRCGQLRADGWPMCPVCGEDELFSSAADTFQEWADLAKMPRAERLVKFVAHIHGCYRCGWRLRDGRLYFADIPERVLGDIRGKLVGFSGCMG